MRTARLNLPEIESSLRAVQADFGRINADLHASRDAMSDEVRINMMAGYRRIDEALARGIDLFALGNSRHLLELNVLVLCGTDQEVRKHFIRHIASTERRFYEEEGGGIGTLMEWLQRNKGDDVWKRAAGAYIHILSRPELYIEGNHRTGALIMSYMLVREGKPPFVLSVENAKAYFDPSTLAQDTRWQGLSRLTLIPKLQKRFADMLSGTADRCYLVPSTGRNR